MALPPLIQRVTADTSQFEGSMGRLPSIAKAAGVAIGAAVVAAATAMVALTRASLANVDALTKQARSLGLTTSAFQAMTLVASEAGVSSDKLAASLGLMQRQIVELSQGSQVAVEAFNALGLTLSDLQGLSPDEQFRRIAEQLDAIADPAVKTATAMEIFGRSGRAVINMLSDYGAKVDEATKFQEEFGIAVNQIDAENIERANDAVGRVSAAFSGLGNILAAAFAPAIERAAKSLTQIIGVFTRVIHTTDANKEAQAALNQALGVYNSTAAPEAQANALGLANAMLQSAKAALTEASAQRELARARIEGQSAGGMMDPEAALLMGEGEAAANRVLNDAEDRIANLEATILGLQVGPISLGGAPAPSPIPARGQSAPPRAPALLGEPALPSIGGGGAVEDQMAGRLEAIIESLATEDEVIAEWYETSRETLAEALASKELTEEEYRELRERLEQEHQDRLNGIREAGESRGMASAKGFFSGMAALAQAGGQKTVKIAAAIGAVQGVIDAYGAALKALNSPEPLTVGQRFAAYAGVLAAGLKGVMSIQQAGRSGSASGAGGAASGATASAAPAMARQNIVIDLVGDTFSGDSVRALFSQINDGLRSGYQIEGVLAR